MEALPKDAYKIVSRWAKNEFYVYIRPVTSKLIDASEKHRTYWVVSVEWREDAIVDRSHHSVKPPQLKRINDRNLMWLAGIIEGEGSFTQSKTARKNKDNGHLITPTVQVSMTDEDTISRVHELTGCGRVYESDLKSGKILYMWKLSTKNDTFRLACLLYPEMSYRRKSQIQKCFGESEETILMRRDWFSGEWRVRKGEGYNLADVIRELDESVPKRRGGSKIDQRDHPGLNAPEKAQKRAQARRRASREDVARHQRIARMKKRKRRV